MDHIKFELSSIDKEVIMRKAFSVVPTYINPFVPVIHPKSSSETIVPKFSLDGSSTTDDSDSDSEFEDNDLKNFEELDNFPTISKQLKSITS